MPNQPLPTPTPPPALPVVPAAPAVPQSVPRASAPPKSATLAQNPPSLSSTPALPPRPPQATQAAQPPRQPLPVQPPQAVKPLTPASPTAAVPAAPVPSAPKPLGPVVPPPPGVKPPVGAPPMKAPMPSMPGGAMVKPPVPSGAVAGMPPASPASTLPPSVPGPTLQTPPSSPPNKPASPPGRLAAVQQSPLKFLPFVLLALVLVGVIGFIATRFLGRGTPATSTTTGTTRTQVSGKQTTITYWGLWEPSTVLQEVFNDFETANPGLKVQYVQESHQDYRERLQTAIASGKGPDAFRFHASWTPMLRNELAAMPSSVYSPSEYQRLFYPVATQQLSLNGQYVGVPLMYDGLALYYNVDMLKVANAQPPTTWADLKTLATQLTISSGDQIQRGGLAIGNVSNVEHFSDILGLLMLQNGADPMEPTSTQAKDALRFYTEFYKTDKVWSSTLPNSTTAFARGDVAMMFAPSWRVFEIKAMNPSLNFATAPVPKLGENQIGWASYWAEGVSNKSTNQTEAWKLLKYMSSPEVMRKLHSAQAQTREFGEIYSRTDLANELSSAPLVVPFLSDAPKAQSWYMNSSTHDNGINDQIIKYYEDAVNAVLAGKDPSEALTAVSLGTSQVLRQYGIQPAVNPNAVVPTTSTR